MPSFSMVDYNRVTLLRAPAMEGPYASGMARISRNERIVPEFKSDR